MKTMSLHLKFVTPFISVIHFVDVNFFAHCLENFQMLSRKRMCKQSNAIILNTRTVHIFILPRD